MTLLHSKVQHTRGTRKLRIHLDRSSRRIWPQCLWTGGSMQFFLKNCEVKVFSSVHGKPVRDWNGCYGSGDGLRSRFLFSLQFLWAYLLFNFINPVSFGFCGSCFHVLGWEARFSEIESLVNDVNYEIQRVERWSFIFYLNICHFFFIFSLMCCRGKEDKDNVVLYFDSWPREELCITLPLKQVGQLVAHQTDIFKTTKLLCNYQTILIIKKLKLLSGHNDQRGEASCGVSLRLLQHWRQVGP